MEAKAAGLRAVVKGLQVCLVLLGCCNITAAQLAQPPSLTASDRNTSMLQCGQQDVLKFC